MSPGARLWLGKLFRATPYTASPAITYSGQFMSCKTGQFYVLLTGSLAGKRAKPEKRTGCMRRRTNGQSL